MTEQKPRGRWRRITDWAGLTEPDKKAEPMRPGFAAFFAVLFSLLGIGWLFQADMSGSVQNRTLFLICGAFFVLVAVGYLLVWLRAKRSPPPDQP